MPFHICLEQMGSSVIFFSKIGAVWRTMGCFFALALVMKFVDVQCCNVHTIVVMRLYSTLFSRTMTCFFTSVEND